MVDNSKNTYQVLRIGFVINTNYELPFWEFEMFKDLLNLEFVSVPVFISQNEKVKKKFPFAYRIFKKFENLWFHQLPDAFNRINVINEFQNVPVISANEEEKINNYNLD